MYTPQDLHKVFTPLFSKGYKALPNVYHDPFNRESTIIVDASGSARKTLIDYVAKHAKNPLVRKGLDLDKTFGETHVDLRFYPEGKRITSELLVVAPTKEHSTEEEFVPLGTFPIKGFLHNTVVQSLGIFDPAKVAKLTK